jgi:hypothetical protein
VPRFSELGRLYSVVMLTARHPERDSLDRVTPAFPLAYPLNFYRRRVGIARMFQGVRVRRAEEGDDPPKIVAGLDDTAERRHRTDHHLVLNAGVTLLLQLIGAQGDQAEQRVVTGAIDQVSLVSGGHMPPPPPPPWQPLQPAERYLW